MKEEQYDQQERIQQYLTGKLSSRDQSAFKADLAEDEKLRAETDWFQTFSQIGKHRNLFDLQEKLQELNKEVNITPDLDSQEVEASLKSSVGPAGWWWKGLLGLCGLLLLGGLVWYSNQPNTQQLKQLTQEYLVPFENVISYDADETTAITLGMTAYERGDYRQAAEQLQRAAANNPEVRLYWGISQLLNKDIGGAIYTLEDLAQEEDSVFANTARFYLALAYLQQQQWDKAKSLLLPLREDPQFSAASQRILDAM